MKNNSNSDAGRTLSWVHELAQKHKKIYSQGGQDGIIEHIISNIDIENNFCVEFGYDHDTLTGGTGPNCANLVINKKWDNLFLGGTFENKEINLHKHFLTTDNILDIFKAHNVPVNLGYLSIDVDSTELWLTDKVLEVYKPSFFSVEFNPNVPLQYAITIPNDPEFRWDDGSKVFGCSLKCLDIISKKYNYSLVYAGQWNTEAFTHDAFFVRNDLIKPGLEIPLLEDFAHAIVGIHDADTVNKYKICLDYEHYLKYNDLEEAQNIVRDISKKLFCEGTINKK